MLIDKAKNRVVVGFDLGNEYSQISYCRPDQSMPETISLVMGEEQYNIPTLLYRRKQENGGFEWSIGREALNASKEGDGTLIDNIVQLAENNSTIIIGEEEFAPSALLGIFIRHSLRFLSAYVGGDDVSTLIFTMRNLTTEMMDMVRIATADVLDESTQVHFFSHEDCFFQYMIHQPEEMWIHNVLLFDYKEDGIRSYMLSMNRKTSPVACFIESAFYPMAKKYEITDKEFLELARRRCDSKIITSVFLLGDKFSKEWCHESLKYLCRGRRVFQGNNLFSKGACYGARERVYPSNLSKSYVYLSDDKLRANVGMTCDRGQTEVYYPILNAGTSWFEANKCFDVMLVKGNSFTINIVPIDGQRSRIAKISLEGLKVRGNKTNRVRLNFYMENNDAIQIEVTDLGFGELFPSTGQVWKECLPVELIY